MWVWEGCKEEEMTYDGLQGCHSDLVCVSYPLEVEHNYMHGSRF